MVAVANYLGRQELVKRTNWSTEEFLFRSAIDDIDTFVHYKPHCQVLLPFEIKHKLANGSIVQYHPTEEDLDAEDWEVTYYPPISS